MYLITKFFQNINALLLLLCTTMRNEDRKLQTATFRQEVISGRKSHKGARYQDILTVSRKVTSN
jgi:hypothetical protein